MKEAGKGSTVQEKCVCMAKKGNRGNGKEAGNMLLGLENQNG